MYIVTNTIKVKTPFLERMTQQFLSSHTQSKMTDVPGFLGFEVFYRDVPDEADVSEVVALSRWESESDQLAWTQSDSFQSLHQHRKQAHEGKPKESPVPGNTVSRYYSAE